MVTRSYHKLSGHPPREPIDITVVIPTWLRWLREADYRLSQLTPERRALVIDAARKRQIQLFNLTGDVK